MRGMNKLFVTHKFTIKIKARRILYKNAERFYRVGPEGVNINKEEK